MNTMNRCLHARKGLLLGLTTLLVTTASLIVDCAIRRKESRGIHYTLDYPESDDRYCHNTIVRRF